MLWKKLVEGRYWKLIDEKAHQSTEGIVTSSPAHYDTSRSAPQASRLQYMRFHYREISNLAP
jgi:hypothetical protein